MQDNQIIVDAGGMTVTDGTLAVNGETEVFRDEYYKSVLDLTASAALFTNSALNIYVRSSQH